MVDSKVNYKFDLGVKEFSAKLWPNYSKDFKIFIHNTYCIQYINSIKTHYK